MPAFLTGLPVHVLVVHAVVVLVPLAALGTVVAAVWPAARQRWGWPVAILTAVAVVSIPIATSSGEGLEHALPRTAAISAHAGLGEQLLPFAGLLLLATIGLLLLDRYGHRSALAEPADGGPGTVARPQTRSLPTRAGAIALAALIVVLALVSVIQVVRIGDSGARAAWGEVQYVQQPPNGHGDND